MSQWQNLNTKKKVQTKTVPLHQMDELRDEIYALQEQGLCIVNSEVESTKTYKISWVTTKEELTEDAIRALMNKNVSPIKFAPIANKKKVSKKAVEKRFKTEDNVMAIVNLADFHFNRMVVGADGFGIDYNIDKAEEVFRKIINEAKSRMMKNSHNVERIILNTAGDFLNSDTPLRTTTNGTPQVDSTTYRTALQRACNILEWGLLELSKIAPVEYYYVAGNHDEQQGWAITLFLEGRFRENPNVTVDTSSRSRATINYGGNVIVMAHGDCEGRRAMDLPFNEPEAKRLVSRTTNMEVLTGHVHDVNVSKKNGVRWEVLSTSCPVPCDWTYDKAYNSNPEATIFYYDKEYRVQQDTIYTRKFVEE